MSSEIQVFLLAMTPLGELRLALPLALTIYQIDWLTAYFLTVIGNLVPVVFLLLFLGRFSEWLSKKSKICQKFFNWWFYKTRQKIEKKIKRYGCYSALILFVAVPLPLTGAWSGAVAAFLFDIPFWKALCLIALGVMLCGLIILLLSKGVILYSS